MHACMHLPVPFSCSPQLSNKHYVRKGGPALLERVLRRSRLRPAAMPTYSGEQAGAALAQLMADLEQLSC